MLRVAVALFILISLADLGPSLKRPPPHPFTDGITDAASLKRVVDARLARARTLLDSMLAVTGRAHGREHAGAV